jgi:uncharacterized protein (DUF1330 family)
MPRAYVIADVEVTDPETYERYKAGTPGSIAEFGGRFVVRGGNPEELEGGWDTERIVVLEFPSLERARAWYASEGYQTLKEIRQSASRGRFVLVEGTD